MDLGVDDGARDPVLDGQGIAGAALGTGAADDRRRREDLVERDALRPRFGVRGGVIDRSGGGTQHRILPYRRMLCRKRIVS